jgi:hypothetical protein
MYGIRNISAHATIYVTSFYIAFLIAFIANWGTGASGTSAWEADASQVTFVAWEYFRRVFQIG